MSALSFSYIHKIDYVSGYVALMKFEEEGAQYFVVRVFQRNENLSYEKYTEYAEVVEIFKHACNQHAEILNSGEQTKEFQLVQTADGLWHFERDAGLPSLFYLVGHKLRKNDTQWKTFPSKEDAIEFGRTAVCRWNDSIYGDYKIIDSSGNQIKAASITEIDWLDVPHVNKIYER